MSYNLFVNCSLWNFSGTDREQFIDLINQQGYILEKDYSITENFDIELISCESANQIIKLMECFKYIND